MSETVMVSGSFTPYAEIAIGDGAARKISLTGFSAAFHKNKIVSGAAWRFAAGVNAVEQHRGAYCQDVPSVDLSISFEPEADLLKAIFDTLRTERNRKFTVGLYDQDSDIRWRFAECYLNSFSFSVATNTILEVSMTFFVRTDGVSYAWGKRNAHALNRTEPPVADPVAYYEWRVTDGKTEVSDVTGFSFSFTQNLTPKYGCVGSGAGVAPISTHVLFGLPEMSCSMSRLIYEPYAIDFSGDSDGTFMNTRGLFPSEELSFGIRNLPVFTVTGANVAEITPAFGGSYLEYTANYDIHGILTQ